MKELKLVSTLLAIVLVAAFVPLAGGVAAARAGQGTRTIDAVTGPTPNYRDFLEADLKSMPFEGGYYSCLKASPPYTFFYQDWYGIPLVYLLDVEVGMKAGTTGIKFIAEDGYSTTLTVDEIRMTNPDGLHSILAWKKGVENKPGGELAELDDEEGPFRLIIPQAVIGPHGVGTDNFNRAVRMLRAIEVQPTPPGMPSVVPAGLPPGQLYVYGNVQNRRTFSVASLKSMKNHSATYKWRNSFPTNGSSTLIGCPLPFFLQDAVGLLDGTTGVVATAVDGYSITFTPDQATRTYPDGNTMLIAWNEDGSDLQPTPVPGGGPLKMARPQTSPTDINKSDWVSNLRVLTVNPTPTGDAGPNGAAVPSDRLIVCGNSNPGNVPGTWYMAEGYTGGGFEEWICIGNPNPWRTEVEITYMLQNEGNLEQEMVVEPMSRATVNVNEAVGNDKNVSAMVVGKEGDSIVAERAMYWNGRAGGHCAAGVNSSAGRWYLAEGCTAGGFETWVLLQNPGDDGAIVNVTYNTASGPVKGPTLNMPAHSRTTVNVADTLPDNWQVSTEVQADVPVIAERSLYWNNRKAGHCASGVPSPGTTWYMAEGCTAAGFETWVLVQNPGDNQANVTINYLNEKGPVAGPSVAMPAHSRTSINVADVLPDDFQVSTTVTSDQPVIAERAMYWNGRNGGHCEHATDSPKLRSYLAEGATDGGFESWILVQNPTAVDATVYITYLMGTGVVERAPLAVPAGKRVTVNEFDDVGASFQVSAQINSTAAVAVERAVYWNGRTEGSCSSGFLTW